MPELMIFQHNGLPYGLCSTCNQTFELVLIGSDNDNRFVLENQFALHLKSVHGDGKTP
jgi:hypothetical protein